MKELYDVDFEFLCDGQRLQINISRISEYVNKITPPVTIIKWYMSRNPYNITKEKTTLHVGKKYGFAPYREGDFRKMELFKFRGEIREKAENTDALYFVCGIRHNFGVSQLEYLEPCFENDEVFPDVDSLRNSFCKLVYQLKFEIRENYHLLDIGCDENKSAYSVTLYAPNKFASVSLKRLYVGKFYPRSELALMLQTASVTEPMKQMARECISFRASGTVRDSEGGYRLISGGEDAYFYDSLDELLKYLKESEKAFRRLYKREPESLYSSLKEVAPKVMARK